MVCHDSGLQLLTCATGLPELLHLRCADLEARGSASGAGGNSVAAGGGAGSGSLLRQGRGGCL